MKAEQLPLFPQMGMQGQHTVPLTMPEAITPSSSLNAAIGAFHNHMVCQGFADNSIKAFLSDLHIFSKYRGPDVLLREIGTRDLNDFLVYLLHYRGRPCNAKSYSRRVTAIKVFFRWLAESEVLPRDPAAPIPQRRVGTPLPQILYAGQLQKVLEATGALMEGEKGDARPHLLVNLLLETGIKKGECVGLRRNDFDLSDRQAPVLYVRYEDPRMQHKERKLALSPDLIPVLEKYLEQYEPKEMLFECTARNLEYVLGDVARLAGLSLSLSFETLRWTSAVHDYQAGMSAERLRKKMGLSKISWRETVEKLEVLASPAL